MSHFKSDFLHIMEERGFIHQISDEKGLDDLFANETVTGYIGFDPTASSLHVGSLIQIMMLYWMQRTGHRPIVLMGGGTGMIGDPSFKDEARQLLTEKDIVQNIASIKKVFSHYLDFEESNGNAILSNNADWLSSLNYLQFLREIGRYFSVNRMLSFDSVKLRLDRALSLSFLEFNYMLLQAYDFIELNKRYDAVLQMGGSDQWGNIVNGIELGHRLKTKQLYALTSPLFTTSAGIKMGKTMNGVVWLNSDMMNPYTFWQFWRNSADTDVIRYLKLYTPLHMNEIARLKKLQGSEINEVKKILATEVTTLLHGKENAILAEKISRQIFEEGTLGKELPFIELKSEEIRKGIGIISLLVYVKIAKSNGEARRYIRGGGIKVNNQIIKNESHVIRKKDYNEQSLIKLSFGKKKHIFVKIL